MTDFEKLSFAVRQFADLTEEDLSLSKNMWQPQAYNKNDFYNKQKTVCRYLGFIIEGVFRAYVIDEKTCTEKNVFLFSANQFVVTFKSFINQVPCDYHTQAIADANVLCISIDDLLSLYKKSHSWERFGRLLAQQAFNVVNERIEGFLFKTPEERYLDLVNNHPDIFNNVPLYHISSYLGIQGPSLSRIRKRISAR
ncbi:Crp/Fnr family transcriptional regulator [Chitinophaga sp. 212800010-3]|uniref:Crp/Fnr family transcriptional regulator n=1 Tax=unclassified Chitinophaga TaxID=2619133 RepID=UPI002DED5912|nr:Cyclic nucleotide-binding domain-containing protein [Chitinophaga sp. 212800010-3]